MLKWGFTDKGFLPKPFEVIAQEIKDDWQSAITPKLSFAHFSIADQIVSVFAAQVRRLWELEAASWTNLDPDSASGRALKVLCSYTGTIPLEAKASAVKAEVELGPNARLPKDSIASVNGYPRARFRTLADVENNTSAKATLSVDMEATELGAIDAPVNELTVIETPVAGWLSVRNPKAAVVGRSLENDARLRERRVKELRVPGFCNYEALRSKLSSLAGVRAALIFNDDTSHHFEVVVLGGEDREIAQVIWENKPPGIPSRGNESVTVLCSQKNQHIVRFSRPEVIPFSMEVELVTREGLTLEQIEALKQSLVDFANKDITLGSQVVASRFYASLFRMPSVVDVKRLTVTDKPLAPRQWAEFAASRINIQATVESH
jgi:uncharacterized phage protein gp47/JayE